MGFSPYYKDIQVSPGQLIRVDATLRVASQSEQIVVTAERVHGEAEAINRERASDDILQVLPFEVITSLPNTNVADALGRLPSVTSNETRGKASMFRSAAPSRG
ncbi:MAG: hypothetical protein H0X25_03195 [Acidobacteriales bacterium]|nr:hypothetical protein [Terriglobales bacterium]